MTIKYFLLAMLLTNCASLGFHPHPFAIPDRDASYPSGSRFISQISSLDEYNRELMLLKELRRGNLPKHITHFVKVESQQKKKDGTMANVTLWVLPDYLAVGDRDDYVRMPMNPITAQRVADHFACILPTTKIVDIIYKNADIKLKPNPFKPGRDMVMTHKYVQHDKVIRQQLEDKGDDQLIAGHKKDIVISNKLNRKPRRVAIYGWHRPSGKPIQPLSTIHGNYYADYSHGTRLVLATMLIDGKAYPVAEVLQDPQLAPLISYEGTLKYTRYPTEGAWKRKKWIR